MWTTGVQGFDTLPYDHHSPPGPNQRLRSSEVASVTRTRSAKDLTSVGWPRWPVEPGGLECALECCNISYPIGSMYAIYYMVTFTINIPQMLAYIPYMDPMGMDIVLWIIGSNVEYYGIIWNHIWMWHVFFQLLDLNIMDIGWFNSRNDDFAGPLVVYHRFFHPPSIKKTLAPTPPRQLLCWWSTTVPLSASFYSYLDENIRITAPRADQLRHDSFTS